MVVTKLNKLLIYENMCAAYKKRRLLDNLTMSSKLFNSLVPTMENAHYAMKCKCCPTCLGSYSGDGVQIGLDVSLFQLHG